MNTNQNYLDQLFENRNQSYGAYILRRDYHLDIKKAFAIIFSALLLLLFLSNLIKHEKQIKNQITQITRPINPNIKIVDDLFKSISHQAISKTNHPSNQYHIEHIQDINNLPIEKNKIEILIGTEIAEPSISSISSPTEGKTASSTSGGSGSQNPPLRSMNSNKHAHAARLLPSGSG